jgi:cyclopropane-fatty-acyl-phospholipid synthase
VVSYQGEGAEVFDRAVSVEMFEHMKNYGELLRRIDTWLKPGGKLFVHIFTHRDIAYHYEAANPEEWLARHFFAGGQMPSHDTLLHFQEDLRIEKQWAVNGTHYEKTANAWLARQDANRQAIMPLLARTYGDSDAMKWWVRWRVFYMACAELWGYRNGNEWHVSHYRFIKPLGVPPS